MSHPSTEPVVVMLDASETHDLRRRVLRDGTPSKDVEFPQDEDPRTFHLGVRVGGELLGVSTWTPDLDGNSVRLRGMAVDVRHQGTGLGAALVREGVARSWAGGARSIWATARDTALDFYVRLGFDVDGDGYVDEPTGLPHHVIRIQRSAT